MAYELTVNPTFSLKLPDTEVSQMQINRENNFPH